MNLIKLTLATLIFVMSFAMQSNEAEADCPTGYTDYSIIATYPGTSCTFEITFCYRCDHFGPSSSNIKSINWELLTQDPSCNISNVYEWAMGLVFDEFVDLCAFPPCNEGSIDIVVEAPLCVKVRNTPYPNGHLTEEITCTEYDNICYATYSICFNTITQEYEFSPVSYIEVGTPCTGIKITPPPGMTWDDAWETDCYPYTCPLPWWPEP